MKRIALIFLSAMFFIACDNKVDDPDNGRKPNENANGISINIHIPKNGVNTYANEDASVLENRIDSIFIILFQNNIAIDSTFWGRDSIENRIETGKKDSIIHVEYTVDKITTGPLRVEVSANWREPKVISDSIRIPALGNYSTYFYMSGKANISQNASTGAYYGEVHLIRNVAKIRVNAYKHLLAMPLDLTIDYANIEIGIEKVANTTSVFNDPPTLNITNTYIQFPLRPARLLHPASSYTATGGQIDSSYVYENLRSDYSNPDYRTKIVVKIPTLSATEGNKSGEYTYTLHTSSDNFNLRRNYIYTLNIGIQGQNLDPLITLDIQPWDDVNLDGSIHGTYLTLNSNELEFDPATGRAMIDFCTDAQAVYLSFDEFNSLNGDKHIGFGTFSVTPIGMDNTDLSLSPEGFKSAQILLDKQHCGTFGFQLNVDSFPGFSNFNFKGSICIKAGNIEKCLTFPGQFIFDAHYIVGEPLYGTETFTRATVNNAVSTSWLQISTNRLYTGATQAYNGSATALYLHLDENIGTTTTPATSRSGSITFTTATGTEKTIFISQLPAVRIGRFGHIHNSSNIIPPAADSLYTTELYMEQLYEFEHTPVYYFDHSTSSFSPTLTNSIYDGRNTAIGLFDYSQYQNLNYQNTVYQAINYCAQKNRISNDVAATKQTNLKWHLPSQAQLMAMWITANLSDTINSSFNYNNKKADMYWSSTKNNLYASEAQYGNFIYGNIGHNNWSQKYWARCVRYAETATASMVSTSSGVTTINFTRLANGTYSSTSKTGGVENEFGNKNKTVYSTLQVANSDVATGVTWNMNLCNGSGVGWRLPTQRELQAIWVLQSEIKQSNATFYLLSNDYYWSQTESSSYPTNAWVVFGDRTKAGDSGNAPNRLKTEKSNVRCVREL